MLVDRIPAAAVALRPRSRPEDEAQATRALIDQLNRRRKRATRRVKEAMTKRWLASILMREVSSRNHTRCLSQFGTKLPQERESTRARILDRVALILRVARVSELSVMYAGHLSEMSRMGGVSTVGYNIDALERRATHLMIRTLRHLLWERPTNWTGFSLYQDPSRCPRTSRLQSAELRH